MCCFSQPVRSVRATNIFVRPGLEARQFIVYSMSLDAEKELAMVLPIPVKAGAGEKDVEFIDLKGYPDFFADIRVGFPIPAAAAVTRGGPKGTITVTNSLVVHNVGDFEASFVPEVKDFSRLDKRFQLPAGTWEKLPQYKNYGFAVFKLQPGIKTVHPMAFSFTRAHASKLFFPTVHIHDGKVHAKAEFDHILYTQPRTGQGLDLAGWEESDKPALNFMDTKKARGLIVGNEHCYRKSLNGMLANTDTWIKTVS